MRGIRKVSEMNVVQGRALMFVEETTGDINFHEVPPGAMKVNPATGQVHVKIEGQSDWILVGIKHEDGTDNIMKDTPVIIEQYVITNADPNLDTFDCVRYIDGQEVRRMFPRIGTGFLFQLEYGTYTPGRNHVQVIVDDLLYYDAIVGGMREYSQDSVLVTDPLEKGSEVTIKYLGYTRPGIHYPRYYVQPSDPTNIADTGDIWIDTKGTLDEVTALGRLEDFYSQADYSMLINTAKQIAAYDPDGAFINHTHTVSDIEGFQKRFHETISNLKQQLPPLYEKLAAIQGEKGDPGIAATIDIIKTVTNAEIASVKNNEGTKDALKLEISVPHGPVGLRGEKGPTGEDGLQGPAGEQGFDAYDGLDIYVGANDLSPTAKTVKLDQLVRVTTANLLALPGGFSVQYSEDPNTYMGIDQCLFFVIKPDPDWGAFIAVPMLEDIYDSEQNRFYFGKFNTMGLSYMRQDTTPLVVTPESDVSITSIVISDELFVSVSEIAPVFPSFGCYSGDHKLDPNSYITMISDSRYTYSHQYVKGVYVTAFKATTGNKFADNLTCNATNWSYNKKTGIVEIKWYIGFAPVLEKPVVRNPVPILWQGGYSVFMDIANLSYVKRTDSDNSKHVGVHTYKYEITHDRYGWKDGSSERYYNLSFEIVQSCRISVYKDTETEDQNAGVKGYYTNGSEISYKDTGDVIRIAVFPPGNNREISVTWQTACDRTIDKMSNYYLAAYNKRITHWRVAAGTAKANKLLVDVTASTDPITGAELPAMKLTINLTT